MPPIRDTVAPVDCLDFSSTFVFIRFRFRLKERGLSMTYLQAYTSERETVLVTAKHVMVETSQWRYCTHFRKTSPENEI